MRLAVAGAWLCRGKEMPFRLFHDLFPDVAERETRTLTVLPGSHHGLPAGNYAFLEMFCDEPRCDCRRVFFWVISSLRKDVEAVVAWGWEDLDFYAKWMKYGSRKDAEDLKGPILNIGSPETKLAPAILELARNVLLQDKAYIERIKRHYRMFRDRIEGKTGRMSGKGRKKAQP
jgi:hypothetical protein